ncbi:hypothetical protein PHIN9_13150 [Polynucleobacter sp. HIN9]|nr:hypothetical protein PHIN9_13150 [Polynucleobacter sp. HIN9]
MARPIRLVAVANPLESQSHSHPVLIVGHRLLQPLLMYWWWAVVVAVVLMVPVVAEVAELFIQPIALSLVVLFQSLLALGVRVRQLLVDKLVTGVSQHLRI